MGFQDDELPRATNSGLAIMVLMDGIDGPGSCGQSNECATRRQ